jgi:hypothetical protein
MQRQSTKGERYSYWSYVGRTKIWFCLGVSLAPLIRIDNMTTFVRSLSQMMEEFDYFSGNSGVQALVNEIKSHLTLSRKR